LSAVEYGQPDGNQPFGLTETSTNTLTNKTIDADSNTISNIGADELKDGFINEYSTISAVDSANDLLVIYDDSESDERKVGLDDLGFSSTEITINEQTGTTYTTILTDSNKLVTLNNGSAITLTIPTNASVTYPVGTSILFQQLGVGLVTMSGADVTFNNRNGLVSGGNKAMWSITKTATDTWAVGGDLTT